MAPAPDPARHQDEATISAVTAGTEPPEQTHFPNDIGILIASCRPPPTRWRGAHGWSKVRRGVKLSLNDAAPRSARVMCLDKSGGTSSPCGGMVAAACPELQRHARRVRHLHHHLSRARSLHFPATAQRAGPADRTRAAALRPVFRARRRRAQRPTRSSPCQPGMPKQPPRPAMNRPAGSLEGHCRRGQRRRRPASMPSSADRTFDAKHFVTGARGAYEMIVGAFAAGDRKTLKGLLSREVYEGFETAIRDRESKARRSRTRSCRSIPPTSSAPSCAAIPRR